MKKSGPWFHCSGFGSNGGAISWDLRISSIADGGLEDVKGLTGETKFATGILAANVCKASIMKPWNVGDTVLKTQIGSFGRNLVSFILLSLAFAPAVHSQVKERNGVYSQTQDGDLLLVRMGESLDLGSVRPSALDLRGKVPKGFRVLQMSFLVEGGGLGRTPMDWLFLAPEEASPSSQLDRALAEKWTLLEVQVIPGTTLDIEFEKPRKFGDPHMGDLSRGLKLRFIQSLRFRDGQGQIQVVSFKMDISALSFSGNKTRHPRFEAGEVQVRVTDSHQIGQSAKARVSSAGR